ncbi:MAG: S8 family peptidase [Bacteroidales bacterium]|nr:S8 family peptidase [Bacteroidales bacterium]
MKRIALLSILTMLSIMGFPQGCLDPLLRQELFRYSDDESIEVVVLMKSQYDLTQLCLRAELFPTKAERRTFVVNELKTFAEASQHDLKNILSEMEQQGLASSIRSLWSANALYFTTTKTALTELAKRNDIESISINTRHQLIPEMGMSRSASASSEITPNLTQVNADQVWALGYTGAGVVVAVVDSGVNYDHLDLADHLWDGGEAFPHHGYDIVNDDDDPMDDKGHGTHVAGIVCGDGTSGSQTGVAPDATLMCVKTTAADGFGGAVNIAGGMEWAVEHGCDLINLSQGMAGAGITDKEIFRRTCTAILDAGIVALVCAGNEGLSILQMAYPIPNNVRVPASCPPPYLDPDQMANPGGLSCVVAVGAVNYNDAAADFTSRGPVTWQDTEFGDYAYNPGIGLIRPDVCAPGVNIKSLDFQNTSGYTYMDGTSQATPCVAGIVALMLQKNPELMPDEICRILEETSVKLTPNKSNTTGVGRVDALAAVNAVPAWDGVNESTVTKALVYPNPSMDFVTICAQGLQRVEILDITGKKLITAQAIHDEFHLDIRQLVAGIYFVTAVTEQGLLTQKLVMTKH